MVCRSSAVILPLAIAAFLSILQWPGFPQPGFTVAAGSRVERGRVLVSGAFAEGIGDLELTIKMDKEQYVVGEPVWVDVVLMNPGPSDVRMPWGPLCHGCQTFRFVVATESDTLPYSGGVAMYIPTPTVLAPGESLAAQVDILETYGSPVQGTFRFERVIPPSVYSLQAVEWRTHSATLSFGVVEPEGRNARAFEGLHRVYRLLGDFDSSAATSELDALLPELTETPYGGKAYFLAALLRLTRRSEMLEVSRTAISVLPNSRFSHYFVGWLMRDMDDTEAQDFVRHLSEAAPNTRVESEARWLLDDK